MKQMVLYSNTSNSGTDIAFSKIQQDLNRSHSAGYETLKSHGLTHIAIQAALVHLFILLL